MTPANLIQALFSMELPSRSNGFVPRLVEAGKVKPGIDLQVTLESHKRPNRGFREHVMSGLKREARLRADVPAIRVLSCGIRKNVDGRDKPGHDEK